jgi:hypothetical protein
MRAAGAGMRAAACVWGRPAVARLQARLFACKGALDEAVPNVHGSTSRRECALSTACVDSTVHQCGSARLCAEPRARIQARMTTCMSRCMNTVAACAHAVRFAPPHHSVHVCNAGCLDAVRRACMRIRLHPCRLRSSLSECPTTFLQTEANLKFRIAVNSLRRAILMTRLLIPASTRESSSCFISSSRTILTLTAIYTSVLYLG